MSFNSKLAVMRDLWCPINPDDWKATPCVAGRVANEEDVKAGRAVFYIKEGSVPADLELPCCGIQALQSGAAERVVVIQAEITPDGTLLGVRPLTGGNGLCQRWEVKLLPKGFGQQDDS
jgi:hypothetical protein